MSTDLKPIRSKHGKIFVTLFFAGIKTGVSVQLSQNGQYIQLTLKEFKKLINRKITQ